MEIKGRINTITDHRGKPVEDYDGTRIVKDH